MTAQKALYAKLAKACLVATVAAGAFAASAIFAANAADANGVDGYLAKIENGSPSTKTESWSSNPATNPRNENVANVASVANANAQYQLGIGNIGIGNMAEGHRLS